MKRFLALLLSVTALPFFCDAAQSAAAKMVCQSVRLNQGEDSFGIFTLDVSSYHPADPSTPPNGELLRNSTSSFTHVAYFMMDDTGFDPMIGLLYVNMPSIANPVTGMNRFFEVSQGVSATTSGSYRIEGFANGAISATWTRQANSATGTCVLDFGSLGEFTHQFSISEYSGVLTYAQDSSVVPGTIALTNSVDSAQWITGSVQFAKSPSNPADALAVVPVSWTNSNGLALTISDVFDSPVYRETERGTNYYGFIEFNDGDLGTELMDYTSWFLYFTDMNDGDHDGIPDFSDGLPRVSLSIGATNMFLSVSDALNSTCSVLEASDPGATNWTTVQSLSVTNDPQVITMPFSLTNAPTFWRIRIE